MIDDNDEELLQTQGVKLFDSKTTAPLFEKMFKRQNRPLSDQSGIVEFLTRGSMMPNSEYHLFVAKETSLANLRREDLLLLEKSTEVVNNGIYLARRGVITEDIPLMDSSESLSWLNGTRSIDMKHERLMAENTVNVRKEETIKQRSFWDRSQQPRQ